MRVRVHSASPGGALEWGTRALRSVFYHALNQEYETETNERDLPYTQAEQRHEPEGFSERVRYEDRTHQIKSNDSDDPAYPRLRPISSGGFN
jgi:hypothetical protein